MKNELPIYEIEGVPFEVDIDYNLLRHANDNQNFVEFKELSDKGTHYLMYFDPEQQKAEVYNHARPGLIKVEIPPMVTLDPERVAQKYNMQVGDLPARDELLKSDPKWYNQRKLGKQPNIDICGHNYFVKVAFGMLEPENLWSDAIKFSDLKMDFTRSYYMALFDPKEQALIAYHDKIKAIPKNAVMVKIPRQEILDPFAVRLRPMGFEDYPERLGEFPVRYDMKAQIIPFSKTDIPGLIKKNNAVKVQKNNKGNRPKP